MLVDGVLGEGSDMGGVEGGHGALGGDGALPAVGVEDHGLEGPLPHATARRHGLGEPAAGSW